MIDILVEISANLFQAIMFIGFLYLFFEKKFTTGKNVGCFLITTVTLFVVINIFTFWSPPFNYFDSIVGLLIMALYSILCLNGKISIKIIISLSAYLINAVLSYLFGFFVSALTGITLADLAVGPSIGRYICIVLVNLTTALAYLIILKFKVHSVYVKSLKDIISFIIVPVLALVVVYSAVYSLILSDYQKEIIPFLIVIIVSMIAIAVMVWLMISRISKDNEIKTKLLLMEQHETLYKENILKTNDQIKLISRVKHDINKNLRCISGLIKNNEYAKAEMLCNKVAMTNESTYTPIATNNAFLNAIVNVEIDKAAGFNLELVPEIYDDMNDFESFSDVISIIGNLCDNAIEYLSKNDVSDKRITLTIQHSFQSYIISCKNMISKSVLSANPDLKTSKSDSANHGQGIGIIKANAKKHSGDLDYYEKDGYIIFTVTLSE
ncbi:MAG: GHKL domain-containing protein [Clostridiales bacterium]|nr:GHKL domain-containing protein [Clostridiales bacterium]